MSNKPKLTKKEEPKTQKVTVTKTHIIGNNNQPPTVKKVVHHQGKK